MKNLSNFKYIILIISILGILHVSCEEAETVENKVPICIITNPENESQIEQGDTVKISIDATDPDGKITKLLIFFDDSILTSLSQMPYEYDWKTMNAAWGSHNINVTAIDDKLDSTFVWICFNIIDRRYKPSIGFYSYQKIITEGGYINFIDTSLNNPTSWYWDFGDGNYSTLQNPTHTYSSPGNYSITLAATNDVGSNTLTKTNHIKVNIIQDGESGILYDYDGNVYNIIKIGTQWWMAENLKTTHYSDGTEITLVDTPTAWDTLSITDKAYFYPYNCESYTDYYGALYTWAAAMNGEASSNLNPSNIQGVCPDGWHLPSNEEWDELISYLAFDGHSGNEATVLKSTTNWKCYTIGAELINGTDNYGFRALPAGHFNNFGWHSLPDIAYFYTSTDYYFGNANIISILSHKSYVDRYSLIAKSGLSVRCVKD